MTPAQFQTVTEEILKNYWRIKAANALYRAFQEAKTKRLEYTGIPTVGTLLTSFSSETVEEATSALRAFVLRRLPRDLYFALIAEFEGRIGTKLVSLGESEQGTLGTLQGRIQSRITLPSALTEEMDEIRERRNVMIHHADIANTRYVTVAAVVSSRPSSFVPLLIIGDDVSPTESYLAYAADVLVKYSNLIG